MKACNAHICCKLRLVGFKTKENPNYTVSSQEKNWFLEEENGVMMGHGRLNYNYRVPLKRETVAQMDAFCNNSYDSCAFWQPD